MRVVGKTAAASSWAGGYMKIWSSCPASRSASKNGMRKTKSPKPSGELTVIFMNLSNRNQDADAVNVHRESFPSCGTRDGVAENRDSAHRGSHRWAVSSNQK